MKAKIRSFDRTQRQMRAQFKILQMDLFLSVFQFFLRILLLYGVLRRSIVVLGYMLINPLFMRPLLIYLKFGIPEEGPSFWAGEISFCRSCLLHAMEWILNYPVIDHFTDHPVYMLVMVINKFSLIE